MTSGRDPGWLGASVRSMQNVDPSSAVSGAMSEGQGDSALSAVSPGALSAVSSGALSVSAVDYILKPIGRSELNAALARIAQACRERALALEGEFADHLVAQGQFHR